MLSYSLVQPVFKGKEHNVICFADQQLFAEPFTQALNKTHYLNDDPDSGGE
jgi:hypothetical protein